VIIDKVLDWLTSLVVAAFSLFPTWGLPTWWATATTKWAEIVAGISDLAHWVPLEAVFQVAAAIFLVSAFAFSVRIGRIIISLFSGGGGSAA
jgi:hypothetical protein